MTLVTVDWSGLAPAVPPKGIQSSVHQGMDPSTRIGRNVAVGTRVQTPGRVITKCERMVRPLSAGFPAVDSPVEHPCFTGGCGGQSTTRPVLGGVERCDRDIGILRPVSLVPVSVQFLVRISAPVHRATLDRVPDVGRRRGRWQAGHDEKSICEKSIVSRSILSAVRST